MSNLPNVHDQVRELTTKHAQTTVFERDRISSTGSTTRYTERHTTQHEPLITQLWGSMGPSGQGGEVGAMTPGSKPAAFLDALDAVARIDLQAHRWLEHFGDPERLDTIAAVRRLGAILAGLSACQRPPRERAPGCCDYDDLVTEIRRWWATARVLTGWESPAWQPDATCPVCGEWRSVRIRMTSEVATCSACHETWDATTIGLLAEHIRLEADEREIVRPIRNTCAPTAELDDAPRMMLCPDCGSSRCVKVLDQVVHPLPAKSPNARPKRRAAG